MVPADMFSDSDGCLGLKWGRDGVNSLIEQIIWHAPTALYYPASGRQPENWGHLQVTWMCVWSVVTFYLITFPSTLYFLHYVLQHQHFNVVSGLSGILLGIPLNRFRWGTTYKIHTHTHIKKHSTQLTTGNGNCNMNSPLVWMKAHYNLFLPQQLVLWLFFSSCGRFGLFCP